jgi:hypothetical protein
MTQRESRAAIRPEQKQATLIDAYRQVFGHGLVEQQDRWTSAGDFDLDLKNVYRLFPPCLNLGKAWTEDPGRNFNLSNDDSD